MELPKWAFKAESRIKKQDAIDMIFSLKPLGRLWLVTRAIWDLIRTSTITIVIEFRAATPVVTHEGEVIEPAALNSEELYEIVKCVPAGQSLDELIKLAIEKRNVADDLTALDRRREHFRRSG